MTTRTIRCGPAGLLSAIAIFAAAGTAAEEPGRILFADVDVFDGQNERLARGMNVLVEANLIKTISSEQITVERETTVIDGKGRTLMPGLIDLHVHLITNGDGGLVDVEANFTWEDLAIRAAAMARQYLYEGFTTVRDMGGLGGGLRRQIEKGYAVGPRVYNAGGWIGPPGGHSDFRNFTMPQNQDYSQVERLGIAWNVNGAVEVTAAARQNFMQGATHLKIMQTGGVASLFDPWQLNGLNEDEIRAAVRVAENYGSYVGAHSYTKDAMIRALDMGVKTIEHGFMFDRDVAKKMKEKGAYLVTQMTSMAPGLSEIGALQDPRTAYKLRTAQAAFGSYVENVKRYEPRFGYMTDCVGGLETCERQIAYEKWLHAEFFGTFHMLKAATGTAGEILALSGPVVNPYVEGKLGVIEEGAYADILLVDGNPLEDITVIGAVDRWFDAPPRDGVETIRMIMKDGVIYKNTLADGR